MSGLAERAFPFLGIMALGVVAYQQIKRGAYPPPPSAFVGVALVFTLLSVLALATPQLASAFGVAIVVWLVFAYNSALSVGAPKEQAQFNQGAA